MVPYTGTLAWVAIVAAIVHLAINALNSNTFDSLLAKFALKPINDKFLPYLALAFGFAGGWVDAVMKSGSLTTATALAALQQAFMGLLAGAAANMHLSSLSIGVPSAPPASAPAAQPAGGK